ncbi:MAG: DUF1385 domain-containing protein [Fimbriimonadaceae bacterium]|nr:DUF1385 domain-containing protein [Fimbriimonadaceae bacterium]
MKSHHAGGTDGALGQLLEQVEPLPPEAAATVAAAILQRSGLPALPLIRDDRFLGVVSHRDLLAALGAPHRGEGITCRELARPATCLPVTTPAYDALLLLARPEVELLVVVDAAGQYLGVISPSRVVEALEETRRPRVVGGLATPVGVYLTTLDQRGGASDLALVLTGLTMAALHGLAVLLVALAVAVAAPDPQREMLSHLAPSLVSAQAVPAPPPIVGALTVLAFLLLLRLSPLSGYHSGEHQTVHALERGLPLVYEQVAAMPRPHQRCGTNLTVLLLAATWLYRSGADAAGEWAWIAPVGLLLGWRPLGRWMQQHFTTRPATVRQVEAGIRAARQLLGRHQRAPQHRAGRWRRFWNRGMLQVFAGALLGYGGVLLAGRLAGSVLLRMVP